MKLHATLRLAMVTVLLTWMTGVRANIVADWGTVATPLSSPVTFSFAQYDITKNFTDQYLFSLQGGTGASYTVSFQFDPCKKGCGNPDLSYGIYDLNGHFIASTNGSVTLTSGNYAFQVKGTGMGSGNSVDYWGNVTFMVSPAPEPSTLMLMAGGLLAFAARFRRRAAAAIAGLATLLVLPACSPSDAATRTSQAIAQVGTAEISMLQFNHALERMGIDNPGEPVRREVAVKLVDRELALQQALLQKLDRQPDVLLQLEEARRDVLARAWAEHTAGTAARIDDNAIARYYADHPALFAERRIFRLREATFGAELKDMEEIKQKLTAREPLEKVAAWLRQRNAGFNEQVVIRAAEQLPIEALPRLNAAREGETVIFETPRGVIAYHILTSQLSPVSWETAKPIVRDYLVKRAGKEAVDANLKQLRGATQIAYLGSFAQLLPAGTEKP